MNPEQWTKVAELVNGLRNLGVVEGQLDFGNFTVDYTHDDNGFSINVDNVPVKE